MHLRFRLGKSQSAQLASTLVGLARSEVARRAPPGRLLTATIVVARDPAFHSYNPDYLQVLQALDQAGARRTGSALGLNSRCLI
jgi:hypothetical protein